KISTHGKVAGGPLRQVVQSAEMPVSIVDPAPIRREAVIANVNIRKAVAIQIAKYRGQSLVPGSLTKRLAVFVEKGPVGPRNRREFSFAVVQIQNVRLAQLIHHSVDDFDPLGVSSADNRLTVDVGKSEHSARPKNRENSVIGNVKIQRPVAVDVGQRHGRAAQFG